MSQLVKHKAGKLMIKLKKNFFYSLIVTLRNSLRFNPSYDRSDTKNSHINLLMNGPCLKDDLQKNFTDLVGSDCLCVNHFADSEFFESIKPSLYLLQDAYFWSKDVDDSYKQKRTKTFKNLRDKASWPITVYIPSFCNEKDYILNELTAPSLKVKFYFADYIIGSKDSFFKAYLGNKRFLFWLWRNDLAAPPPENALIGALFLAERLGYQSINFYGANMSFFKDIMVDQSNNTVYMNWTRFYEQEKILLYKEKAFNHQSNLLHEFKKQTKIFQAFYYLSDYLKCQGIRVINASSESYLDCFDRADKN
jgi:hypothetical protein